MFYIIPQNVENNSHPFHILHIVSKEIVSQSLGNLDQQRRIDTFTLENIIHIGTVATKFVCEPGNGATLTIELLFDDFTNVYHEQ